MFSISLASWHVLVACLCIASNIRFVGCERPADVEEADVEEAEVRQHIQQDLVRRQNQTLKGFDLSKQLKEALNQVLPYRVDTSTTGFPGIIEVSQSNDATVGCATIYQNGDEAGLAIAHTELHVDVDFTNFILSSPVDKIQIPETVKKYLKGASSLDGVLQVNVDIPVQHIGFQKSEPEGWNAFVKEEETQHIQVTASKFIQHSPKKTTMSLDFLTNEIPGFLVGGKKSQNFLDWIMKSPKFGIWPIITEKVATKLVKVLTDHPALKRLLAVTSHRTARAFFSKVADVTGYGNVAC